VALGLVARRFGSPVAFAISAALFALVAPGYALLGRVVRRSGVVPAPAGVPVG
jgi:hypothetical protein